MLDLSKITLGCELEIGDIDVRIPLPEGNKFCKKDGSIMNSLNGTANDPKHEFNKFGGEIQTSIASTPQELLDVVKSIYDIFGILEDTNKNKYFNFTTNLHVHCHIPGLKDDLESLKKIAKYTQRYGRELFNLIEPIPVPTKSDFTTREAFKGAWTRYKRRKRSHHYTVPKTIFTKMMAATTPQEFYEAHAAKDKDGKFLWHLVIREAVNLKQIFSETETIEFRHFTMSKNLNKMYNAFLYPLLFLKAVFSEPQLTPQELFARIPNEKFQEFHAYNYELDKIFQLTNIYHNSRPVAKANYDALIAEGKITKEDLGL